MDTPNIADIQKIISEIDTLDMSTLDEGETLEYVSKVIGAWGDYNLPNVSPILPLILSLNGEPFHLGRHKPMEVMYNVRDIPQQTMMKCGRQVSKSTTLAAQGVIRSAATPYLNTIYITPLFEQIRRFSSNYVKPFIEESQLKKILLGSGKNREQSVFQRTFKNNAKMFFSFAFLDADRVRGISGDILAIDEVQDIDHDFIPVLMSCLDASDLGLVQYSGTPKTTDNAIEIKWQDSSMAEWVIPCPHCKHWNICNVEMGMDKMIREEGPCCQKCSKLVNPGTGFFYHFNAEKAHLFAGYHMPQIIFPMHYENENRWYKIWDRSKKYSRSKFLNEILGESCDTGAKLVTKQALIACSSLPWKNTYEEALKNRHKYTEVVMGVDWGGGGGGKLKQKRGQTIAEEGTASFTALSIVGLTGDGKFDVLYSFRMPVDLDPKEEAKRILTMFRKFKCSILAHDYGGAGNLRETMMHQAGLELNKIMPITYVRAVAKPIIYANNPERGSKARWSYSLDKTRSLALTCALIRDIKVRLPKWTSEVGESSVFEDFLALIEDTIDRNNGPTQYLIKRHPKKPDDICHSINFAFASYWHRNPDLLKNLVDIYGDRSHHDVYDMTGM